MTQYASQPPLPDLAAESRLAVEDFARRILTCKAMGAMAVRLVEVDYGRDTARRYRDELWDYRQLKKFSQEAGYPDGTAPQVFSRWHQLVSRQLDLLPITFESAKKQSYDLSLLGAVVVSEVINTPVTKDLLSGYHHFRLERLTDQA